MNGSVSGLHIMSSATGEKCNHTSQGHNGIALKCYVDGCPDPSVQWQTVQVLCGLETVESIYQFQLDSCADIYKIFIAFINYIVHDTAFKIFTWKIFL